MSYASEVLADSPVLYLRLDKTGVDSDGDTWPDSSGNGLDATQIYNDGAVGVARGYASPIETDGASREFYGWRGVVGRPGRSALVVPTDPLIEPAGDFTLEAWIRPVGVEGDGRPIVGKRGTCGVQYVLVGGTNARLSGFVYDSAGTKWEAHDLSFDWKDYLGTSFFCVVRRIGDTLSFWVNGTLRAATAISSGLPTKVTSEDFHISETDLIHDLNARQDEIAFFTAALSDDRILAHYEAALLNPPLHGRADLHMRATLDGNLAPTPQLFPFSHNWETEVKETLAWSTDVMPAEQDYEQRAAIRQRPRRELELAAFVPNNALRRRLHAYLFQNHGRTIYLGDETEAASLTANVTAGATSLSFVSTGLGFEDGGLLAIYQDETTFEILEIDTVATSSTTLAGAAVNNWTKGSARVVPVVRAIIAKDLQLTRHTDALEELPITFRVLDEDSPVAPRRNGTYTPRYTYQGIEVFDPFVLGTNNWEEDGRGRVTLRTVDPQSPAGIFSRDPLDTAPRETTSYSFFLEGRAAISQFLAWAYAIQGRRVPLWIPTLQSDFSAVSTSGGLTNYAGGDPAHLIVAGHDETDYFEVHDARRDLALVYNDDSIVCKRIHKATAAGANDDLTIEQAGALTLTNLRMISFLKLSRLNEDTIGLTWHTDRLVEVTLNFVDLLTTP